MSLQIYIRHVRSVLNYCACHHGMHAYGSIGHLDLLSATRSSTSAMIAYFRLMAAIFDLTVTPTSEGIRTSPTVLLDPENEGVAVGISLLSYIQAEIYDIAYDMYFRFMASIFDIPVTTTSECIHVCPIVLLDLKNGAPFENLLLSR